MKLWPRGVDLDAFEPGAPALFADLPRPIWLYVGRLAVEKSVEDFLKADLPGAKVIVGDGPQASTLREAYPEAVFLGPKFGGDLTECYQACDVFVFPSRDRYVRPREC